MRKRSKIEWIAPGGEPVYEFGAQECIERCQRSSECHMVGTPRIIEDGRTSAERSVEWKREWKKVADCSPEWVRNAGSPLLVFLDTAVTAIGGWVTK